MKTTLYSVEENKKLVASELRYRRLFETAQDGVLLVDFDTGMILDVNPFLIDMLGYSKDDFLQKHLWEVGVFKDVAASKDNFATLQKKRYVRFEDLPLETKSGKKIDVEFVANAYEVEDATIIQCNIRDITDRKIAEDKIKENEILFRGMFENISSGVVIYEAVDEDGSDFIIKNFNHAAEDIEKISKDQVIGKNVLQVFPGVKEFGLLAVFQRVYKTGKPERLPISIYKDKRISGWKENYVYRLPNCNVVAVYDDITEKKQIDEALKESQDKFYKAFQTSPYAITITRVEDGKFLDVNDAFISLTGYSREEALRGTSIGLNLWASKDDRASVVSELQAGRKVVAEEYLFRKKDGEVLTGLYSAQLINLSQGICILSSIADISDRKKAEDALARNESYLRATLDSTDDGILAIDNNGKVLHSNARFVEFWKIPEKIIQTKDDKTLLDYVLEQLVDPDAFISKVTALYKSRETSFDTIYFKDGRIFERYSTPLLLNDQIVGRVWSFRDVTKRINAENEVLEAKAKSDAILSSIGDAVFATDTKGTILLFNPMAVALTGIEAKDAIGKRYSDTISFIRESDGKQCNDFIAEAIQNNKITKMANHVMLVRSDGRKIPVADSAAPIKNPEGKIIGCVVVFHDVTRERQIDKAKTEFVSLASHQLRTPLSTINWYSEMLLSEDVGKLSPKQRQYSQDVYHASQRMVSLINALLNVSRLELGTFAIEPELVDIQKIATSSLGELEPLMTKKHVTVKNDFDAAITMVKLDPKLLTIVFQNLLSNAIKYSKSGDTVGFTIKNDNDSLLITVKDTGIGIPEEQKKDIFSKLFRADNAKKVDPDGSGLGLYIVKEIIDHSGGRVWFESREGVGSTFFVSMPLSGMAKKEGDKKLL